MTLIHAYKSRALDRNIVILDADEETITPGTNDVVRVTIGREGETAKLTLTSSAASVNGSLLTKGASNQLRIVPADLAFDPGVYSLIVDYYDNASARWKIVEKQVFSLEGT